MHLFQKYSLTRRIYILFSLTIALSLTTSLIFYFISYRSMQQEKARKAQEAAEKAEAEALSKKLEGLMVKIPAKAGEGGRLFGAVTGKEISDALSAQHGVSIPKAKLVLDEPIKSCGSYQIKAKLGYEVSGTVYVMVVEEK